MTAPEQQRELIDELTARTAAVAEAASRAVEGLPATQDELVSAVIAQLRSVNDECQRINGVLERVAAMIVAPAPPPPPPAPAYESPAPAAPVYEPPPAQPVYEPPPPPAAEPPPPPPPVAEPPPPPPPPAAAPPPPDPYGPPPGAAPPEEEAPIAVPSSQYTGTPEPVAYEGTGADEGPPSEGIRLLATQMAVAGETVADIERRLRNDFGVANASQVVRELFGPS
jgi:hypothetical protein